MDSISCHNNDFLFGIGIYDARRSGDSPEIYGLSSGGTTALGHASSLVGTECDDLSSPTFNLSFGEPRGIRSRATAECCEISTVAADSDYSWED